MRVMHVITRLIVGGAQENTLASVLGLRELPDLEVRLLSGPSTGPEGSLEPLALSYPGLLLRIPHLVRPVHPWKDLLAWAHLLRIFRREKPDLVHTHSGKAGILGRLAARQAGVPIVVHTIHGPSFGDFQGRLANTIFLGAERRAARCTTHFVAVSHAMTRQYLAAGIGSPGQYTRVLSGFPLEPFLRVTNDPELRARYGLAPEHLVVGKIARLSELKGHEDLIEAAPSLVQGWPQVRFLLVGDGALRSRLEARIREMGLERHFVFTGLVSPNQIPELVGLMDVVVHLSRREGLPRALPQALAAGRPVVAFDCDGASEVCLEGRTGFLVRPGDQHRFQEAVGRLLSDSELRSTLGRQGRELVEDAFSVERMVRELDELYRELARQLPGRAKTEPTANLPRP